MTGSNEPSRSRGTSISTGPIWRQYGLGAGPVTHVLRDRCSAVFVTEMLGQFCFQSGLEHALRELAQQASRPDQAHALVLRLRERTLCERL